MIKYFEYFIQGSEQLVGISAVALVWFSLTGLGAWFSGRERVVAADVICGWALVSLILTLGAVFSPLSLGELLVICVVLTVLSFVFVARREGLWLPVSFFKLILLAIPLLLIASSIQGSQWDEFSDWLAIPRYMFLTNFLPSAENPYQSANTIAYPYNWHFINYIASTISGRFLENVGPLFNVLLLFAFSLGLLNVINRVFGDDKILQRQSWSLIAFVGLATTLFNPTFAQKIVLTSYADTSTAVATGFCIILAWFTLECLAEGNRKGARNCAVQLAMAFALLINLKQATIAICGLIVMGFLVVAWRDSAISLRLATKIALVSVTPAILTYLAWRYYIAVELIGGEATFMKFSEWHFDHIFTILLQMLITLLKKGYYLLLVLIIIYVSIKAFWKCQKPVDRLFLISGILVLGYNGFLFFTYLSSFGESDAIRVASFWRYNMHLGGVVLVASSIFFVTLWSEYVGSHVRKLRLSWLAVALLLLSPFLFAKKLRFDLHPTIQHYRHVGSQLSKYISPGEGYFVLDPQGTGESYNITNYEMNDWADPKGYLAAYHNISDKSMENLFTNKEIQYVLIHSLSPLIKEAFQIQTQTRKSQLFIRKRAKWDLIATWVKPVGVQ